MGPRQLPCGSLQRSYPFPSWLHALPAFLCGWRCSELVPPSPAVQRSGSVNMDAARLDLAPEITKGRSYPFPSWLHALPAFLWGWRCSELVPPSPAVQRSGSVNVDAARLDLAPEITTGVSRSILS
ncbi:hypothetical protein J6590_050780 [Homalodisca vitripennis]|nr:hypothetical protein J6590_050780 [Homalodisca vitripennis]